MSKWEFWTAVEWPEHDWFIPKDIWRIFDSKDLVDFIYLQWQIFVLLAPQ